MSHWRRVTYHDYTGAITDIDTRDVFEIAAEANVHVILPRADELLMDIDSRRHRKTLRERLELLRAANIDVQIIDERRSQGWRFWHPKYHVTLRFPRLLNDAERIAWQAVLGSDTMREFISMVTFEKNIPHPTVFFEPFGQQRTQRAIVVHD